ncbi:MAG: DUF3857 domain-containing protein [Deltaproteobacteria bacterium]|nr:DUF3857 domain-containing protein [Deltaproteobacteria bacterium]
MFRSLNAVIILLYLFISSCASIPAQTVHSQNWSGGQAPAKSLFFKESDIASLENQLRQRNTPEANYILAYILDETGTPEEAFEKYLRTVSVARTAPNLFWEGTAAAIALVQLRHRVQNFEQRISPHLKEWSAAPGTLSPEALFQLRILQFSFAQKRGHDDALKLLENTGCLLRWQLTGPLSTDITGRRSLAKLIESPIWPGQLSAGAGRPLIPVENRTFDVCQITSQPLPDDNTGYVVARTAIHLSTPQTVWFRFQSNSDATIYIDGEAAYIQTSQERWLPESRWLSATLPPGSHQISVSAFATEYTPSFSLAAITMHQSVLLHDSESFPLTTAPIPTKLTGIRFPAPLSESARLAQLRYNLWNVAPHQWQAEVSKLNDNAPFQALLKAEAALTSPYNAIETGMETARQQYEHAFQRDSRLYRAARFLAQAANRNERTQDAFDIVNESIKAAPKEPTLYLTAAELAYEKRWMPFAQEYLMGAKTILGDNACPILMWDYAFSVEENRFDDAMETAQQITKCTLSNTALATEFSRRLKFDAAAGELAHISQQTPFSPEAAIDTAMALLHAGKETDAISQLNAANKRFPLAMAPKLYLIDAYHATSQTKKAMEICRSQAAMPLRPDLQYACDEVAGGMSINSYRVDGLKVVADYQAGNSTSDRDFSWVLDRMVLIIDKFGAGMRLVHWVGRINSMDAVSEYGELPVPPGAEILQARVIKPDLSVLYPSPIDNKSTLSMPRLAIGDYVEYEGISYLPPHDVFKGGFDSEPFFFQDFNSTFVRSELIVVAPREMPLQFDPRGDAPEPNTRLTDNIQVVTFRRRNIEPLQSEPDTPDALEFLPSVRVTAAANNRALCEWYTTLLHGKSQQSPKLKQFATKIALKGESNAPDSKKADRIYTWIIRNIENDSMLFEPVTHIYSRRRGNRARLFQTMLNAVGINARLGLATHAWGDHTRSAIPDMNRYSSPLILLPDGTWVHMDADETLMGTLPAELKHQSVLLPDTCEIAKTNSGRIPLDETVIDATIALDDNGSGTGTVTESITGEMASLLRSLFKGSKSEHRRIVEEHLLASKFPEAVLQDFSLRNIHDGDVPLTVVYHIRLEGMLQQTANGSHLFIPLKTDFTQLTGGLAKRAMPLVLATYMKSTYVVDIELPQTLAVSQLPQSQCVSDASGRAEYCIRYETETENHRVRIERKTHLNIQRIAPEHYTDFQKFVLITERMNSESALIR